MNREIKFRAWDESIKTMIYGIEMAYDMRGKAYCNSDGEEIDISILEKGEVYYKNCFGDIIKKGFPIMQYTGLRDGNGKEVYEGDVISFDGNMTADNSFGIEPNGYVFDENSKHEVIWNQEQATWDLKHMEDEHWKYMRDCHGLLIRSNCKVIGNIYENPELLK